MKNRFLSFWHLPTGPWLAVGVLLGNLAAAIPFGVSDTTSGVGPNTYEWIETVAFAILVVALLSTIHQPRWRSWVASLSGGLWFGTSIANLFANYQILDRPTLIAYTLLPLGLSMCSFALARVADIEWQLVSGL